MSRFWNHLVLPRIVPLLRRISAPDSFADAVRVLLAMLGVVVFGMAIGHVQAMIAMLLGVIAAALAETEDGWKRRLRALLGTLVCFLMAAFIVEWLFAVPWAFAIGLTLGSFLLVMLGAVSPQYATIAFATLLLAVYTMIGMDATGTGHLPPWQIPLLLTAGALWYGLLAIGWSALFVHHAVRRSLAQVYDTLADYMELKSRLFEPVRKPPVSTVGARLAEANTTVVQALNACRMSLVDRLNLRHRHAAMERLLRQYLAAQDIHERASSTHYPYQELAAAFFHSDVMFRSQRLVRALADACRGRAHALRSGEDYILGPQVDEALDDLRNALARHRTGPASVPADMLQAVERLTDNLAGLLQRIRTADARPETGIADDLQLHDPSPTGIGDAWQRMRMHLTPASARFRHALRLSLAMLVGYIVLEQVRPTEGYWILLTVMLVCQPNLYSTRTRVLQRVGGTATGLLAGWALLKLFGSPMVQLEWMIAAGVVFFVTRYRHYLMATAAITVFVLLAFNQIGNGFELIWPRLLDTLIGSLIAVAVTFLVLPDWRERELRLLFAALMQADARYLRAILAQYASGKNDDLAYRLARRDAHDAHAELNAHLASSLQDPGGQRADPELVLRLLGASQELLSHLSTLGVHRQRLASLPGSPDLLARAESVADDLEALSGLLQTTGLAREPVADAPLPEPVVDDGQGIHEGQQLLAAQVRMLQAQYPVLRALTLQLRAVDTR